jgi:hypothetical protein
MLKRILAAFALGLGTLAALTVSFAQSPPNFSLPPNTVVGRLGIGPGPAQAIPLKKLFANINAGATYNTRTLAQAATISPATQFVMTAGFAAVGDGGAALYMNAVGSTPCGFQSADGAWWQLSLTDSIRAQQCGAKGDSVTDDSPAVQAALYFMSAKGGGGVKLTPTGHAYLFNTGLIVSDATHYGASLEGDSGFNFPAYYDNTEADWTANGTWIHCTDTVNPCLALNGQASHVSGLNFWYTQPTPASDSSGPCPGAFPCVMSHNWTPTTYPFTISILSPQKGNRVSDIQVVNGTHCLDIEGPSTGVGSIYTHFEHLHLGCFNTAIRFNRVDNVVTIDDFNDQVFWFQFSRDVVGYMEGDSTHTGHKIGWDMNYVADLIVNGAHFYQDWAAISANNQTVTSGLGPLTFAVQGMHLTNVGFNQVCQAIVLGTNAIFEGRMTNVFLNTDFQVSSSTQCSGYWKSAFNLNSNNAELTITNLKVYLAQIIATIGGGTTGILSIHGIHVGGYANYINGDPAFVVASGASLDIPHDLNGIFTTNGSAGPIISGAFNWLTSMFGARIQGNVGTARQLLFSTNLATGGLGTANTRWGIRTDATAESGSNAGSLFSVDRYNDDGSFNDSPIVIPRTTGVPFFKDGIAGTLPTSCSGKPTGTIWVDGSAASVLKSCP